MPGRTITQRTVPARVVWAAAVDPSPIAGYELQSSVDGGPWGSTLPVGAATRLATLTQDFGHAYQYRVRAQDAQGDWSAWAPATAYTSTLVQDVAPAVTYTGSWVELRYRRASSGNLHYAVAGGASAKITFDGRAVGFVAPVGPTRGSAKIYWDGVYRSTISFAAAKAKDRVVMYSIGSATAGFHTLEIRLVGDGRVDVDAFVTFR
jgi:hypothetical protein